MRCVSQLRGDEAAGLFLRRPADLHLDRQAHLDWLPQADAAVANAYRLTQEFTPLVRERGGDRLNAWLAEADACTVPALTRFAAGLRAELAAVRAGLTESRSNGPTGGFIHRLKLLKRQAYGRFGFAILRERVPLDAYGGGDA